MSLKNKNTITADIHRMNANAHICIITIRDGDELVVDNSDIGLESNEDGTANTVWLRNKISSYVNGYRKAKVRKINSKIPVSVEEGGE